jgi:hypothetical protein
MSLRDWFRKLFGESGPDHPLSEQERHEHRPETAFDVRGRFEQNYAGEDFDPDEPRSGRV